MCDPSGSRAVLIAVWFRIVLWCPLGADLQWSEHEGYRSAPVSPAPHERTVGFTLLDPAATGVDFTNQVPAQRHLTNQVFLNGSGVAAGDIDGDGLCDLFFCGLAGTSALYRNQGGWKFENVTTKAGLVLDSLAATGVALADVDGDGDLDLLLNTIGQGTHLYLNNGRGSFREAPLPLNPGRAGMSLALGDIDGDGFLDLYVANYRTAGLMDIPNARGTFKKIEGKLVLDTLNGRSTTNADLRDRFIVGPKGNIVELGEEDVFYQNSGGTNFTAFPFPGGNFFDDQGRTISSHLFDWGLSVMIRDANGDGLPDIYVCNDFQSEDRFWLNQGEGKLRLAPPFAQRKCSLFCMGVDFADLNRDGFDDFFLLDMLSREHGQRMRDLTDNSPPNYIAGEVTGRPQYGMNTLFLNRHDGTYSEIAQLSGVHAAEWAWSCIFLDVDLDGWEDLLISNGMERAGRNMDIADEIKALRSAKNLSDQEVFEARKKFPRLATANLAFRNKHDLTFEETGQSWGFNLQAVSQGMALADLDNDGDLDVVINNFNGAASVYRNDATAPRIAVRLKGLAPNTQGINARVTLKSKELPAQSQEIISGGRYLSSDQPMRTFGAGSEMSLEVRWRSGKKSLITNIFANRIYEIHEQTGLPQGASASLPLDPLFQEISGINFIHVDESFDDDVRQPLLPNKLSHLGPGLAWFDLDGDGWEDLIIGSGASGRLGVFHNNHDATFSSVTAPGFDQPTTRDQAGLVAFKHESAIQVLAGVSNYEDGLNLGTGVISYDGQGRTASPITQAGTSSNGPLALADIDGDGDLDLFVGGRVIPGKYPAPASSQVFRFESGKWIIDAENSRVFEKIGLVSAATFSDIDGDGDPDLLLACEWGSIKLFINTGGLFTDRTEQWGLSAFSGWWNGIAVADFNGDGLMDFAASNWGRNTKYEESRLQPLQVIYGDLDGDGTFDLIEAHYDSVLRKTVPERPLTILGKALPFLRETFPTHQSFCTASNEEMLGPGLRGGAVHKAQWLESTVFLNRTNYFEAKPLPIDAQFSPAFGLCAADFDGDGIIDLMLAQNFFGVQPLTPRYDGGCGLFLKGDGTGRFKSILPGESGVRVYGEGRGIAAADFDHDGRMDFAVAQNSAPLKLFRNRRAIPSLRVTLEGSAKNSAAIGAQCRLKLPNQPRHELHAGSGYWSQDAATLLLPRQATGSVLEIRWPDRHVTETKLPGDRLEMMIGPDGSIRLK
jgi:hypothetical protein